MLLDLRSMFPDSGLLQPQGIEFAETTAGALSTLSTPLGPETLGDSAGALAALSTPIGVETLGQNAGALGALSAPIGPDAPPQPLGGVAAQGSPVGPALPDGTGGAAGLAGAPTGPQAGDTGLGAAWSSGTPIGPAAADSAAPALSPVLAGTVELPDRAVGSLVSVLTPAAASADASAGALSAWVFFAPTGPSIVEGWAGALEGSTPLLLPVAGIESGAAAGSPSLSLIADLLFGATGIESESAAGAGEFITVEVPGAPPVAAGGGNGRHPHDRAHPGPHLYRPASSDPARARPQRPMRPTRRR